MGSTTKIWTLDLTAHALKQGVVHLNDQVTINPYEAGFGPGNSLMRDVNGTPLEAGEVVSLDALVRGLMYQSGNNAAIAIARHVARAYYGPAADWQDFVSMMNAHAAALGQVHTVLSNPQGIDILPHHTSARELAEEFQHGLQDPYFAAVVGFRGVYNATGFIQNGMKSYSFAGARTTPAGRARSPEARRSATARTSAASSRATSASVAGSSPRTCRAGTSTTRTCSTSASRSSSTRTRTGQALREAPSAIKPSIAFPMAARSPR